MTVSKKNLFFRLTRLAAAVFLLLTGTLPITAETMGYNREEVTLLAPSVTIPDLPAKYSNYHYKPASGEYGNGIITDELKISYNAINTSTISGSLEFQKNILDLQGNSSFSQSNSDPITATRVSLNNANTGAAADLSGLSLNIHDNTVNATLHSTDIAGAQGDIIGALVEGNDSDIGNLTITNNTVNSALDTHLEGTQIFGAEVILNSTGYGSTLTMASDIDGNKVNIIADTTNSNVYGTLNSNVVGGQFLGVIKDNAFNGMTVSGNVQNNVVTIEKGIVYSTISGGSMIVDSQNQSQTLNMTGNVQNNQVVIKDGEYWGSLLTGGNLLVTGYKAKNDSTISSNVQNNTITITGGEFYGGYILGGTAIITADNTGPTYTGSVTGNIIDISGNTLIKSGNTWLSGGFSNIAGSSYNHNTLKLSTAGLSVYGVDAFDTYQLDLTGAQNGTVYLSSTHGNGRNNFFIHSLNVPGENGSWDIDGATVSWASFGRPTLLSLGGTTTLLQTTNGFQLSGTLSGASDTLKSFTEGAVTYTYELRQRPDRVDLIHTKLATTGDWSENIAFAAGSYSGDDVLMQVAGKVTAPNITVISNSAANASLTAGTLDLTANNSQLNLQAAQNGALNATFNTIKVGDGYTLSKSGNALYTFTNLQMDGSAQVTSLDVSGNAATATLGSTVNANFNTINLADGANLTINTSSGGTYTFNDLNVYGTGDTFTGNLNANGKNLNFFLADTTAANTTALNVTGTADITGSTVRVGILGSSSALQLDDQIVLVNASTLTGAPSLTSGVGMQGLLLKYDFDLSNVGNQLLATVTSTSLSPRAKSFSEGRMAASALINQGADFAVQDGIAAAQQAASTTNGLAVFSALGGGKSRYETGSHVNLTGFNASVGLSHEVKYWFNADWLLGSFIEYGNGHYDTYNSYSDGDVKGKGDSQYIGLGVLGRRKTKNNTYLEISARVGQTQTDFKGPVYNGSYASYDYKVPYYGAHGGFGYLWQWTENSSLDLSAKYLWAYQSKKALTASSGDSIDFGKITSSRARLGAQLNIDWDSKWNPYLGLAYDYEFSGKATASAYGMPIEAPDLQGGTGIAEAGLRGEFERFVLSFGGQGYIGKRRGASGNIRIGFAF